MKNRSHAIALLFALGLFPSRLPAQPAPPNVPPAMTHHEQAAALGGVTKAERLDWMRQNVTEPWRLDKQFKNFEGRSYIEPTIPGVTKNVTALNSLSQQQAKGAARTLLFATEAYHDQRFRLVAVDQPLNASYGRTDKDLVLRHKQTGQRCRIEVKDVKPSSQRADLERIKGQIDKMAAEYRQTGELQAWANRQETIPAIKEYAKERGVPTYEKIKQSEFPKVLDDLDSRSLSGVKVRFAAGAVSSGLGVLLLYTSGSALLADLEGHHDDLATRLRMGENASLFVGGGAMTAVGIGTWAKLEGLTKWGGKVGIAAFITAEGFAIVKDTYQWKHLSEGQKYVALIRHGSNALMIGAYWVKNPWVAIPMLALGGAGHGVAYLVDKHYAGLEVEQKEQIRACIYQHYGVSQ